LVKLNYMQKRNISELVEAVKVLQPNEKFMIYKALYENKELTNKDIKIMEWAVDAIKVFKKHNEELKKGLEMLNQSIEKQNKKSWTEP